MAAAPAVVAATPEHAISYQNPACPSCGRMIWIEPATPAEFLQPRSVSCDCGWVGEATIARRI